MSAVSLLEMIEQVSQGNTIASFPTDTVPALATVPDAAELIYIAKQRSHSKSLILMASAPSQIWDFVTGTEAEKAIWQSVMAQYWPGALTLVLPASNRIPTTMNPLTPGSIGIRIPKHRLAREILRQTGPLATTSANLSGTDALLTMDAIAATFPQVLQLSPAALRQLDVSAEDMTSQGTPSTVIKWVHRQWQILRQGAVILPQSVLQAEPGSLQ